MQADYEVYMKSRKDIPSLTYHVYSLYENKVRKYARRYSRISRNFIDEDDYASEVYIALQYFLGSINPKKVTEENFHFDRYVTFAILRILGRTKRAMKRIKCVSIHDEKFVELGCTDSEIESVTAEIDVNHFIEKLTPRQQSIFKHMAKGFNSKEASSTLGIRQRMVNWDIRAIRRAYTNYCNM